MISESIETEAFQSALDIVNNWRASHNYPLNTFQAGLRKKLKAVDSHAIVAQRLKRLPSIVAKLRRMPESQLVRMQDIGGLRAVVKDVGAVKKLHRAYIFSRFKHALIKTNDYIEEPKASGYRSIHLVYRYTSALVPDYNKHLLELQIRTKLQHAWATAVETVGTFLAQSLKASEGEDEWLDFFSVASSAFAILEGCPVAGEHSRKSPATLFEETMRRSAKLGVVDKLRAFGSTVDAVTTSGSGAGYYLVVLTPKQKRVEITGFDLRDLSTASSRYLDEERKLRGDGESQVVLLKAQSVEALKKAYPNYFLDTHVFLEHIQRLEFL